MTVPKEDGCDRVGTNAWRHEVKCRPRAQVGCTAERGLILGRCPTGRDATAV